MKYNGPESLPMVRMVFQVRHVLEELNISVPWNDDGPLCELDVPHNGSRIRIRREFSAATGRLFVKTILKVPISSEAWETVARKLRALDGHNGTARFIRVDGYLACSEVLEVLPDDVTVLFMGQLLDRTTKQILRAAESTGIIEKA